jgi:HPt (histidine-containing phosphotransfer) domain-containing protein
LTDYPNLLSALRAATEAADSRALHRAAHTIRGALNTFGAKRAAERAAQLETLGRQNNFAEAASVAAALAEEMEAVRVELTAWLDKPTGGKPGKATPCPCGGEE